jgi:hypothetical protein
VILKNENVAESLVLLEVQHTVTKGPEYIFNLLFSNGCQGGIVIRGFDNHFMGADPIHFIKQTFSLTIEIALNT